MKHQIVGVDAHIDPAVESCIIVYAFGKVAIFLFGPMWASAPTGVKINESVLHIKENTADSRCKSAVFPLGFIDNTGKEGQSVAAFHEKQERTV